MIFLKLFVIFGTIFAGFAYLAHKFNNPYKLIFIFGKKGSGKSTYMVKMMLKDIKQGWHVYTNIDDIMIPGVRKFDVSSLITCAPDEKSAIYVDEGGLLWDNRNFKNFDKGYTEFFKLQRKYKCKVVINSQSFDIDLKIRQLVDRMILVDCIGGWLSIGRPILRSVVLTEPVGDAESRIADRLRFDRIWRWKITYLPRYFKYFDSFAAPKRNPIPFREVVQQVKSVVSRKPVKRAVRESLETDSK